MKALIVDIGSNSIRSMKAECTDGAFRFFNKHVYTTRLAEGLINTHRLSDARIRQSLAVLCSLRLQADADGLAVLSYATSAVRDADNRNDLVEPANRILGTPIRVLSGHEEAALSYDGATGGVGGLIDIGGGSTQIIADRFAQSYPLGCVRGQDACSERNDFAQIQLTLLPILNETFRCLPQNVNCRWTGVGGTVTTIAALLAGLTQYSSEIVHGSSFTPEQADKLLIQLGRIGTARAQNPLLAQRHDVILYGGAILLYVMRVLKIDLLSVSDRDGMEGFAQSVME